MPAARTAHPTRSDLPSLGRVPPQLLDVLVVDVPRLVLAEEAGLPLEDLGRAAARTTGTRPRLTVPASLGLRGHRPKIQAWPHRCRPHLVGDCCASMPARRRTVAERLDPREPMAVTEVCFARSAGVDVAYRVVGDGPIDLVYVEGAYTHLEVMWELPQYRRWCERLAEFTRLILFDKRGMGMSDRVPGATTLEERMDDIRAIMDAAGSERAAIMGESEGGPLAMLFAAAHPERTIGLVLQGAEVRERRDDEWPWGEATDDEAEEYYALLPARWGQGLGFQHLVPSVGDVEWGRAWMSRLQLHASTPARLGGVRADGIRDRRASRRAGRQRSDPDRPRGGRPDLQPRERALPRANDPGRPVRRATRRGPRSVVRPRCDTRRDSRVPHGPAGGGEPGPDARDRPVHGPRRLDGAGGRAGRPQVARPARAAPSRRPPRARPVRRPGARHRRRRLLRHVRRPGACDPLRGSDRRVGARARPSRAGRPPHGRGRAPGREGRRDRRIDRRTRRRAGRPRGGARLGDGQGAGRRLGAGVRGPGRRAPQGRPGRVAALRRRRSR